VGNPLKEDALTPTVQYSLCFGSSDIKGGKTGSSKLFLANCISLLHSIFLELLFFKFGLI
jgi:hypothetical protein